MESKICGNETILSADADAGATSIFVKSLKPLNGIGANATVLVTSLASGLPINGLYLSERPSGVYNSEKGGYELKLGAGIPVALKAGDIVRR